MDKAWDMPGKVWSRLRAEIAHMTSCDPLAPVLIKRYVDGHSRIQDALVILLSDRLNACFCPPDVLHSIFSSAYAEAPYLSFSAAIDLEAIIERDPATAKLYSAFLFSKGFQSLQIYRVANWYWGKKKKVTAEALSSACCAAFGVDIHPAAQIGMGILLDHADGIVMGETATIGDNVTIFHGVTLGAEYGMKGDRHPKVADGVMIGANATIIGNVSIGENSQIGCGAVVLSDIDSHSVGVGIPAKSKKIRAIHDLKAEVPRLLAKVDNDNYII